MNFFSGRALRTAVWLERNTYFQVRRRLRGTRNLTDPSDIAHCILVLVVTVFN
jgi:hypothetical protein